MRTLCCKICMENLRYVQRNVWVILIFGKISRFSTQVAKKMTPAVTMIHAKMITVSDN